MLRQVTITLPPETVALLKMSNNALYVLKGVKYGFKAPNARAARLAYGGGAPLVWLTSEDYLAKTVIAWEAGVVKAYLSTDPIVEGHVVSMGAEAVVELGQTVNVSPQGGLSVVAGGLPGAVRVINRGTDPWTCGVAQGPAGPAALAPTCAFPLYGGAMDAITPQERVVLMFALNQRRAGSVMLTAYANGLLVDASEADRIVGFDINLGWSADGGGAWATQVAIDADLGKLLITT